MDSTEKSIVSKKGTEPREKKDKKIDKKKLIVYSEIMKPKFDEI